MVQESKVSIKTGEKHEEGSDEVVNGRSPGEKKL